MSDFRRVFRHLHYWQTRMRRVSFIMERIRANIIYASFFIMLGYLIYVHIFDKAVATENCFDGVITKVESIVSGSGIRSGGTISIDYYAHITIDNGIKIVKRVGSEKRNNTGTEVELKEYKSKIRGITKYRIANCK